jgi:hypothetical protein
MATRLSNQAGRRPATRSLQARLNRDGVPIRLEKGQLQALTRLAQPRGCSHRLCRMCNRLGRFECPTKVFPAVFKPATHARRSAIRARRRACKSRTSRCSPAASRLTLTAPKHARPRPPRWRVLARALRPTATCALESATSAQKNASDTPQWRIAKSAPKPAGTVRKSVARCHQWLKPKENTSNEKSNPFQSICPQPWAGIFYRCAFGSRTANGPLQHAWDEHAAGGYHP